MDNACSVAGSYFVGEGYLYFVLLLPDEQFRLDKRSEVEVHLSEEERRSDSKDCPTHILKYKSA